jgi:hypothetical protein
VSDNCLKGKERDAMDDSARERKEAEAAEARRNWRAAGWAVRDAAAEIGVEVDTLVDQYASDRPPYPDPERPGVYRVPLGGRTDAPGEALVDAADLPLIDGAECYLAGCGPRHRARGGAAHVAVIRPGERVSTPLRRVIAGVEGRPRLHVNHLNGDPRDCRRANLLVTTAIQRVGATGKIKARRGRACSSRFKGVTWNKASKKWLASIGRDGDRRQIGRFDDEIAAALAYDAAARALFGEHAYLNFPDGVDAFLANERREADDAPRAAA